MEIKYVVISGKGEVLTNLLPKVTAEHFLAELNAAARKVTGAWVCPVVEGVTA